MVSVDGYSARTTTTSSYLCISSSLTWSPFAPRRNSSPDCPSDTGPALSFWYQTNGFAALYKGVVVFEPGSGRHCIILVTRYLLVSRVENEVNNDLKSSLLGNNNISGSYKSRKGFIRFQMITRSIEDISYCLGVMSTFKESDSRSAKRLPSQENSLQSEKWP